MTLVDQTNLQAVMDCQRQFWQALEAKDARLFSRALADDFVCFSPNQAQQSREAFIATLTGMPVNVVHVSAEQVAVRLFGDIAVLTGVQLAQLALPDRSTVVERLALTNVFRRVGETWQMVVAHPVTLDGAATPDSDRGGG